MRGVLLVLVLTGAAHAEPVFVHTIPSGTGAQGVPPGYSSPDWPKLPVYPVQARPTSADQVLSNIIKDAEQTQRQEASVDESRARFEAETRARAQSLSSNRP